MLRRRSNLRLATLAPLLLLASACGGGADYETPGTPGELGQGIFRYTCVEDGDAVCNLGDAIDPLVSLEHFGSKGELPQAVAVGARFDLSYQGGSLSVQTQAAKRDVSDHGGFVIEEAGLYAFLAKGSGGEVADFTHVQVLDVAGLDVWSQGQVADELSFDVGADVQLAITPTDAQHDPLAGALSYSWESSDPTVLALDGVDTIGTPTAGIEVGDDEVRAVAIGQGVATLTVTSGDLVATLSVTVGPEVMP